MAGKRNLFLTITMGFFAVALMLFFYHTSQQIPFWVQNLSVEDIASIEAVSTPGAEGEKPQLLTRNEMEKLIEYLQENTGKRAGKPEVIFGQTTTFYITLKDGTTHTVANVGNVYFEIDGITYEIHGQPYD